MRSFAPALSVLAESTAAPDAIGVTNQRETTIVWDRRTGQPLAPAIVWQCRRTAEASRKIDAAWIAGKTGLVPDAYFSATKIQWILEHSPEARAMAKDGEALFGTVDSWLIWKLTNGAVHVTDQTNASRTMLMNLATREWDNDLLSYFDIPRAMLPRIVGSSEVVGVTAAEHLGKEVPIAGIAGDQQAALAGQACFRPGLTKNTYGTGCFALMHTGQTVPVSRNKLLGDGGGRRVRDRGQHFHRRRGGAVASRQARHAQRQRGVGNARPFGSRYRRCLCCPGVSWDSERLIGMAMRAA